MRDDGNPGVYCELGIVMPHPNLRDLLVYSPCKFSQNLMDFYKVRE